jgi:hypothetical protein
MMANLDGRGNGVYVGESPSLKAVDRNNEQ